MESGQFTGGQSVMPNRCEGKMLWSWKGVSSHAVHSGLDLSYR